MKGCIAARLCMYLRVLLKLYAMLLAFLQKAFGVGLAECFRIALSLLSWE